ncbi:hypothetical protein FHS96_002522 [Sphingomonas zeicaulis]|uniref:hypothetical protein n=1 Tax=Sphingomonas zeicaulis TaxID=1632740 RepID=UPI003D21C594
MTSVPSLAGMARLAAVLMAPLLLAACFFSPGKFAADLDVAQDGRFSFAYKGEIVIVGYRDPMRDFPSQGDKELMNDFGACFEESGEPKPGCSAEEQARIKRALESRQQGERDTDTREFEVLRETLGFDPSDEKAVAAFAARLKGQNGWREVTYKGNGVFAVDYAIAGTLDRDFVWPVIPGAAGVVPFVVAQRQADGRIRVRAPGFGGFGGMNSSGPMTSAMMGLASKAEEGGPTPDGLFTIVTGAEVLANNNEDGWAPDPKGRRIVWKVGPANAAVPEALLGVRR